MRVPSLGGGQGGCFLHFVSNLVSLVTFVRDMCDMLSYIDTRNLNASSIFPPQGIRNRHTIDNILNTICLCLILLN